jgi:hypothetical protein
VTTALLACPQWQHRQSIRRESANHCDEKEWIGLKKVDDVTHVVKKSGSVYTVQEKEEELELF